MFVHQRAPARDAIALGCPEHQVELLLPVVGMAGDPVGRVSQQVTSLVGQPVHELSLEGDFQDEPATRRDGLRQQDHQPRIVAVVLHHAGIVLLHPVDRLAGERRGLFGITGRGVVEQRDFQDVVDAGRHVRTPPDVDDLGQRTDADPERGQIDERLHHQRDARHDIAVPLDRQIRVGARHRHPGLPALAVRMQESGRQPVVPSGPFVVVIPVR